MVRSQGLEHQLVVARFLVEFLFDGGAGEFCHDQLAGGVDDAALAEVAADGGQVLLAQGDVQMAAVFADGAVGSRSRSGPKFPGW